MKKILAVLDTVPHCSHGGGGITAYAAVKAMQEQGNEVLILSLSSEESRGNGNRQLSEHVNHLESHGIKVVFAEKSTTQPGSQRRLLAKLWPSISDELPGYSQRQQVAEICRTFDPHFIFTYHWNGLAAVSSIKSVPKLGIVGDPLHLPEMFRREFLARNLNNRTLISSLKSSVIQLTRVQALNGMMRQLLNECELSGAFAAHHAAQLREAGATNCEYFRTPVPDPLDKKPRINKSEKFKILHIGHLQGIATLSGVELLAFEILPILSDRLPSEAFEIHIVGGYYESLPSGLKKALDHPNVKIRGQISPADDEFLSSHVVIVPTPIELGIRVRILTALSFGSCVIAHQSNEKGIPELESEKNCILAHTGKELAEACLKVYKDTDLRVAIEARARRTYEECFSLESAGKQICDAINRLDAIAGTKASSRKNLVLKIQNNELGGQP